MNQEISCWIIHCCKTDCGSGCVALFRFRPARHTWLLVRNGADDAQLFACREGCLEQPTLTSGVQVRTRQRWWTRVSLWRCENRKLLLDVKDFAMAYSKEVVSLPSSCINPEGLQMKAFNSIANWKLQWLANFTDVQIPLYDPHSGASIEYSYHETLISTGNVIWFAEPLFSRRFQPCDLSLFLGGRWRPACWKTVVQGSTVDIPSWKNEGPTKKTQTCNIKLWVKRLGWDSWTPLLAELRRIFHLAASSVEGMAWFSKT